MKRNSRLRVQALGLSAPLQNQWCRFVANRASWLVLGGTWSDWASNTQVRGAVK